MRNARTKRPGSRRTHLVPLDLRLFFRPHPPRIWCDLHWPSEVAPDVAAAALRQIGTDQFLSTIVLEVEAAQDRVAYRIGIPAPAARRTEQLIPALVKDAAITPNAYRHPVDRSWRIVLTSRQRPLKTDTPEAVTRAILAALTGAHRDERVVLQWLLGRAHSPRAVAENDTTEPMTGLRLLVAGTRALPAEERRALQIKRGDFSFACVGRVGIAATPSRQRALAVGVLAALRTASAPGVTIRLIKESADRLDRAAAPFIWPSNLNVAELLGLVAWPLGKESLPGISRDQSRTLRADERIKGFRRVLGAANAPGDDRLLGLSINDARHHLHCIGPTGVGKSTLLANLIVQDAAEGRSIVVIEPKGDLIEEVLARLPAERTDDVVILDPSERDRPVGLNPLLPHGRRPELIADQVLAVFHGLWASNWGPRLQDILHSSLLTLAGREDASLCLLPALLTNPAVRRRLRSEVQDPIALEPFWAWFDAISEAERQQAIAPVLNKLRPFLLRPSVRAIVGQVRPRFRIDEIFTGRKIVLVSLAKGLIGPEAASLLGSLFVAELWQAILGRASVAAERRHPVLVYADEFQDYVHLPTDMSDALAQARGLGVGLTLAHQHLAQLPAALRASVLANARSRVCFQLAAEDAQTMSRFTDGQLDAKDFQRLRRFEAYAQLMVGSEVTGYASLRTLPLAPAHRDSQDVRQLSRSRYGRPLSEVDEEIRRLLEEPGVDAPVGRRRRTQP